LSKFAIFGQIEIALGQLEGMGLQTERADNRNRGTYFAMTYGLQRFLPALIPAVRTVRQLEVRGLQLVFRLRSAEEFAVNNA